MGVFITRVERFISWWEIPDDASRLRKLLWFLSRFLAPFAFITIIFTLCARWQMVHMALAVIWLFGSAIYLVGIPLLVIVMFPMKLAGITKDSLFWKIPNTLITICFVLGGLALLAFFAWIIATIAFGRLLFPGHVNYFQYLKEL